MKLSPLHLEYTALLISTYDQQTQKLESGLLLDPSLTIGTLTRLIKIRKALLSALDNFTTARLAIAERSGIKEGDILDPTNQEQGQYFKEMNDLISIPVEIEFEPIDSKFIDNIIIAESNINNELKENPDKLFRLLEILKGEYIYIE